MRFSVITCGVIGVSSGWEIFAFFLQSLPFSHYLFLLWALFFLRDFFPEVLEILEPDVAILDAEDVFLTMCAHAVL